jgi:DNA-directed RNA polymerase sigma subunit (sigma70/sigma32)
MARSSVVDEPAMGLEAIGRELGLTKQGVGQIEKRALAKLRRLLEARGIDADTWCDHLAALPAHDE